MLKILLAFLVDLVVGDPRNMIHPVVLIGRFITWMEKLIFDCFKSPIKKKIGGLLTVFMTVVITYFVTLKVVTLVYGLNFYLGLLIEIWLLSTTIAVRGLGQAGLEIYKLLKENRLAEARYKLSFIVGRDTKNLDESEITRGAVETVAENIVDGVISPLCFAVLGGVPLAMAYKAINTLDSMVGYKNERYMDFGWAAARLDDIANYIPSRITGCIMFLLFLLKGVPLRRLWQAVMTDAPKHPSPNSGIPEAIMAAGLGVRLGGLNYYGGIEYFRAYMGEQIYKLNSDHIRQAVLILYFTSGLFLGFILITNSILRKII